MLRLPTLLQCCPLLALGVAAKLRSSLPIVWRVRQLSSLLCKPKRNLFTCTGVTRRHLTPLGEVTWRHLAPLGEVTRRHLTPLGEVTRRHLAAESGDKVTVVFQFPDGTRREATAKHGDSLLDVVIDHDVDIDGFGACEGTLACSTCHLIIPDELFKGMAAEVSDEEMDMLDLAFGVEDTSRLGCQCLLSSAYEGQLIRVPEGVNDQRGEDGGAG